MSSVFRSICVSVSKEEYDTFSRVVKEKHALNNADFLRRAINAYAGYEVLAIRQRGKLPPINVSKLTGLINGHFVDSQIIDLDTLEQLIEEARGTE